jgi:hypothetical protein
MIMHDGPPTQYPLMHVMHVIFLVISATLDGLSRR